MSEPEFAAQAPRRQFNRRQAATVERLVAATVAELRETDFAELTVRAVAARAGVAAATAYTYFSSKNHLVAEVFWRRLAARPRAEVGLPNQLARVRAVFADLGAFLADEPLLAAAVTSALLGPEPDVRQLRLMIGTEITGRIDEALDADTDDDVRDALALAWTGALLQAGTGHAEFADLGRRLGAVARLVLS